MTKKRLLVFHPTLAPYRADFFNTLSKVFDARICFCAKFGNFNDTDAIDRMLTFDPIYIRHKKHDMYHAPVSEYFRQLNKYDNDIVITGEFRNSIPTLLYKCLCWKKFKVVSICDDSYDMIVNNNDYNWKHKLLRKVITPFLDDLILVEPNVQKWYQKFFHKGIWFPIIRDDEKTRNDYQRLLSRSQNLVKQFHLEGKHVFLFVGRLVKIKNARIIIEAFSHLNKENNILVIIGSGEEEQNLRHQAKDMQNVIFTGRLEGDNLYSWYNIASVFVLASTQEPFGAVTNEALLAGCWSLISKRAGSQCLIKPGVNGDVFDPTNVKELIQKMEDAANTLPAVSLNVGLRENRMLVHFKELMNTVINKLNQ